jgi:hypothetical protein
VPVKVLMHGNSEHCAAPYPLQAQAWLAGHVPEENSSLAWLDKPIRIW